MLTTETRREVKQEACFLSNPNPLFFFGWGEAGLVRREKENSDKPDYSAVNNPISPQTNE